MASLDPRIESLVPLRQEADWDPETVWTLCRRQNMSSVQEIEPRSLSSSARSLVTVAKGIISTTTEELHVIL
jgi:hypothetical protein